MAMAWLAASAPAGICSVASSSETVPPADPMGAEDWLPVPVHATGVPPVQTPLRQVSLWVQPLPSLHAVASASADPPEQAPVDGLHVPPAWHWSAGAHALAFPLAQAPFWHWSLIVHAFPSLQVVPLVAIGLEQAPLAGSQVPATWH